ncbi:PepSY-associated TM region [Novosphingobium sp. CF614]|uniref:PepSY domain-containing protein n=1 Tax=Novosphingobium sp. CF614 TaxID=1884364 RepID=UPI0008E80021|nr:PepSY domain-containing protein [Novosphingobium sp. CF614]SFF83053.1 PepSY-associated TM region [Novosphingobium sp. CF614]
MVASKARRWNQAVKQIAWFHRWLGIATCLVFAMWFASGAVLLFKPFPSLSRPEQLRLEAPIDLAAVGISPAQAAAKVGDSTDGLRLVQRGNAPAYIVSSGQGVVAIDARTGQRLRRLSPSEASAIARQAIGQGTRTTPAFDYDQWIVHNRFDPLRPFHRIDAGDRPGTQYYLSAVTGELVQRTTATDRAWNWAGAVLHWVYFTPVRSNFTAWDRTVWYLSLVAMLVAIAGTVLGIVRTLAAQKQRKPSLTFYRLKWMRWHHLLGLFASIFVLTWILSGWLSMDHGRLFSRGQPTADELARYAGLPLARGLVGLDARDLQGMGQAREIDFSVIAGQPAATAWRADGSLMRVTSHGRPLSEAALLQLAEQGARSAWPAGGGIRALGVSPSNIYALAEGWPATAMLLTDPAGVRPDICVDSADGRMLTVMDGSRKVYAWIYYGLHTFNFPGLANRPLLRESLVLVLMLVGFAFSVTGVVIGWQRLRRSF